VQISEVLLKVCRVVDPCQAVNARRSLFLQVEKGHRKTSTLT
jgi:hypothetical protein